MRLPKVERELRKAEAEHAEYHYLLGQRDAYEAMMHQHVTPSYLNHIIRSIEHTLRSM